MSAFVESPTFGGNSWLAHISLLSGLEIRDEDANVLLMRSKRETLISTFARRGYRAIAMMPGLQQSWPEGIFYGFNAIYDGERLDYKGPPFGWWTIPDQFAVARLDAAGDRAAIARAAVRVLSDDRHAYAVHAHGALSARLAADADAAIRTRRPSSCSSWSQEPDWMNLGPSYAHALGATYTWIGGLLRKRADRDLVMILIGDHQPPALVSGEGASWDVPGARHREPRDPSSPCSTRCARTASGTGCPRTTRRSRRCTSSRRSCSTPSAAPPTDPGRVGLVGRVGRSRLTLT